MAFLSRTKMPAGVESQLGVQVMAVNPILVSILLIQELHS
jgi:hypothetical protein